MEQDEGELPFGFGRGRGRSRGRGRANPEMQARYDNYIRERDLLQNEGQPAGLSSLVGHVVLQAGSSEGSLSPRSGSGSTGDSISLSPSLEPTPTPPDSDSPPLRSPSPTPSTSFGIRGRGRSRIHPNLISPGGSSGSSSGIGTGEASTCEILAGPLRTPESILPDLTEEDQDDIVRRIRELSRDPSGPRGRGRGRPPLAISTNITEDDLVQNRPPLSQAFGFGLGRGRGRPLGMRLGDYSEDEQPQRPPSRPVSDIVQDLAVLEREVVVRRGTKGRMIPVTCNYIKLGIRDKCGLFEYHVDFDPPVENRRISRFILQRGEELIGPVRNFDGAKLYLPFRLGQTVEYNVDIGELEDRPAIVKTRIRFVKENKLENCVHFYNVLFRRIMEHIGLLEMKRHFYDYRAAIGLPQHKLELWPGFITAVDVYEGGLMLLCDSSFRVLSTSTLFDTLRDIRYTCRHENEAEIRKRFEDLVIGKIIFTKYNDRHYRVDGVDWEQSPRSTFDCRGVPTMYEEYYRTMWHIDLTNFQPPLIVHRPVPKPNSGRLRQPGEIIYLIPEICYLTGLNEDITSNVRAMQDMAFYTRISPQKRDISLKQFVKNVKENEKATKILADWGLELEDGSVELDARQFPISNIEFGNEIVKEGSADFGRLSTSLPCYSPVPVHTWAVFCTNPDRERAHTLLQMYNNVSTKLGIPVTGNGLLVVVNTPQGRRNFEEFRKTITQNLHDGLQFIIVIVPRQQDDLYSLIKKITCVERPIPSQVILSKTLNNDKNLRSKLAKIILQINCKLGGALWTISIPLPERIMFLGMDVYHDPKRKFDSVTALVASLNPTYTKYFSRVSNNIVGQETTSKMRIMFREALLRFHEENNCWPDRIVVFRDGVGDGQLETTADHEVVQMTETVAQLCQNNPKFSFTVVQKRIHTKIYASNGRMLENPPPGTVLDHTVTRRFYYDFFLVSQLARQGAVTPTHYIVLKDNEGISPDLIQRLAFVTSFMYYNWAGSIRVPAVCQYAHKLAYLVGQHLRTDPSESLDQLLYYL